MIRFNPFTSSLKKNNRNVGEIIGILRQFDYDKAIRRTPQIYMTEFNEMENFYAIENEIPELLVKSNKLLKHGVPESHYSNIDIKYYFRKFNPEIVLKGNRFTNSELTYKNYLLTRLWFERKEENTEVRVLMEKGSFHYSYLMTINHQHTFEEAKNNDWSKRLTCSC